MIFECFFVRNWAYKHILELLLKQLVVRQLVPCEKCINILFSEGQAP